MNKILKSLLTLVLLFSVGTSVNAETDGDGSVEGNGSSTTYVATVNDQNYETVQAAIDSNDQATIQVVANTNEDITVPSGKTITLVIADGVTITNSSSHTITNNGTLTVAGAGTVDNISHGKGAVYNNVGAKATLEGSVTFTRSRENGITAENSGGNSWYTIKNFGTMSINGNVVINQGATGNDAFSSLIANGWYDYGSSSEPSTSNNPVAILTINGGTIQGGRNTVKNDDGGYLYINGGSIVNSRQAAVFNVNVAEINSGTFSVTGDAEMVVFTRHINNTVDQGKTTIKGGNFTSGSNNVIFKNTNNPTLVVQGGTYSVDVSKYLVEGNEVVKVGDKYKVVTDGTTTVETEENTLAYDEQVVNHIQKYATSTTLDEIVSVEPIVLTDGDTYKDHDVTKEWEASDYKKAFDEYLKDVENVDEVIPYNIALHVTDKQGTDDLIDELDEKLDFTLFLNSDSLSKVKDKKFTLYNIYYNQTDKKFEVTPVTSEKTTVTGNSISFKTDRFSIYALVTFKEVTPTPTPTASSTTKKSSGGWDDGGPFTTDNCGNVFDRWGNKIYEAKGCNVGGYNLVRTSVED